MTPPSSVAGVAERVTVRNSSCPPSPPAKPAGHEHNSGTRSAWYGRGRGLATAEVGLRRPACHAITPPVDNPWLIVPHGNLAHRPT
jgi:hypothetical protein